MAAANTSRVRLVGDRSIRMLSLAAVVGLLAALVFVVAGLARADVTFTVDTTADTSDSSPGDGNCADSDGDCSLRAAIEEANALAGTDAIAFAIDGSGPHTIAVLSALPEVTEAVVIDATTEPDFSGTPVVELTRGDDFIADGLWLSGGNSTVRGLAINLFRSGILITDGGGNIAEGNFIGTDVTGTVAVGNSQSGVRVVDSSLNTIGGISPEQRNLLSGNGPFSSDFRGSGISIEGPLAFGNVVIGNFVGTDVTGTAALGNGRNGVAIAAPDNQVGGTEPGAGNLISGNGTCCAGVLVHGEDAVGNTIIGNQIGTDVDGLAAVGNGAGVWIRQNANSTTIGGTTEAARNIISGNGIGILIQVLSGFTGPGNTIQGNYVGVAVDGSALGNTGRGLDVQGPDNQIGGTEGITPGGPCTGACNVISANGTLGVLVWNTISGGNVIEGNYVGMDPTGTLARGNGSAGVQTLASGTTVIGGTATGAGNLISANGSTGLQLSSDGHVVQGNLIGTDITGTEPHGNFVGIGVSGNASNNLIGGTDPAARNVVSASATDGIAIRQGTVGDASDNIVQGNYVGTDITGTLPLGNSTHGVFVEDSPDNLIGGTADGAGNLISANGGATTTAAGVFIFRAPGNLVQGNLIGTDVNGTAALGNNGFGVFLLGVGNILGGTDPGAGNVISGNTGDGVLLGGSSSTSTDHVVQGNLIGTDISGTSALGNGGHGVRAESAPRQTIGGAVAGAGNVISANALSGVFVGQAVSDSVVQGNLIGTSIDGTADLGNGLHGVHVVGDSNLVGGEVAEAANRIAFNGGDGVFVQLNTGDAILSNSIHSNAGLGIDLAPDGVTPNDEDDSDTGPNNLQNFPVLSAAFSGSTVVEGTLNSTPNTTFRVEFFSNATGDPSGHGEGEVFLGSIDVTTDSGGDVSFSATLLATTAVGDVVTATATDPDGNTSEFSGGVVVEDGNSPPDAQDDSATTDEDTPVVIDVLANDTDPDDDTLTVSSVSDPLNGSVVINIDDTVTYTPDADFNGSDSFTYEASDGNGGTDTAMVSVTVNPVNDAPVAVDDAYSVDEDTTLSVNAPGVLGNDEDVDGDSLTAALVTVPSNGTVTLNPDGSFSYTPDADFNGEDTFTYTASDGSLTSDKATVVITVNPVNDPPVITSLAVPIDPQPVGTTIDLTAAFADPDSDDTHTFTIDWDDGAVTGPELLPVGTRTITAEHTYTEPGVFTVVVTVDDGLASDTESASVVIFDPDGGFVTGGGWIQSPEGAYTLDPTLTGKAHFGFVSKYQEGAITPTGETEFQFRAAGLDFHSTEYQWLVVSGPKAQFKGSGTINREEGFGFLLTVNDGEVEGGGGIDRFRIKIWDKATDEVIYDNQPGDDDDSDATTELGGGSIVIHVP